MERLTERFSNDKQQFLAAEANANLTICIVIMLMKIARQ